MARRPSVLSGSDYLMTTLWWMHKQGFKPVRLHPRSKAAVDRQYVDLNYSPPPDDIWRNGDFGLGVVTGPRQSGPIDGDLDCPEALFFASKFLPPTDAVFGRASKPRSHYLYKVDAPAFDKRAFIDPVTNETIVEMRGDGGHQTVAPGSIHQDTGELIEWSDKQSPDVPQVSASELDRAFTKIAIATLLARHVWASGYHNEPAKHLSGMFFYLEWAEDEVLQMISALMEYSGDDDKSRLATVRLTFKRGAAGQKVSGAGVLRKQLKNDVVVDKLLEWAGSRSINVLQEYNDRYAVVSVGGKFRIADCEVPAGEPPVFYQKDDFLNLTSTDVAGVDDKGRPLAKAKIWLASARRRQYRSIDFVPGEEDTGDVLNLWTGWGVEPGDGSCKAWLKLVKTIVCGDDAVLYQWLLHWFANIVREPLKKSLTAPVVIGEEGAGKSLMLDYFGKILGPSYVVVSNDEHIHGRFNKHLSQALLLHSAEALYGGEKKHAGIIRSLITDEYRVFEPKGVDASRVRNHIRLVLTSNDAHAAPAKPGDRRYTVFNLQDRKADERLVSQVLKELDSDGPAALFKFLLDMKYDPKIPRVNIKNEALSSLKTSNLEPYEAWWYDALYEGAMLPDYLAWASVCEDDHKAYWPIGVATPALYMSFLIHVGYNRKRNSLNGVAFAMWLNKVIGRSLVRSKRMFENPMADGVPQMINTLSGRMTTIVNMPSLDECRKAFEKYLGQQIDWPMEDVVLKKAEEHERF